MEADDRINRKMQKLKALAEGTSFEHERQSALEILHKLMEKYGVSEHDLDDISITTHEFKCKGERELELLFQVARKILGSLSKHYTYRRNGRKVSNKIGIDCTLSQKIEIDFLFSFYRKLYKKEEKALFTAFIHKHKLHGVPTGDSGNSGKEMSPEELIKHWQMMSSMENATPHKLIERKENTVIGGELD